MITIAKNCRRVPLSEMPTVTPTSLANKAMKTFPVITIDVIRPVSKILVIVLNRFISVSRFQELQLYQDIYLHCGSGRAVGFRSR